MSHIPGWRDMWHEGDFSHNHFVSLSLELLSEGVTSSPEPLNNRILVIASSSSILLKTLQFLFALCSTSVHLFAILNVITRKIHHSRNQKECSKVMNMVSTRHNYHPLFTVVTTRQNPVKKCCLYLYHAMLLANYSWMHELGCETLPNHNQIQEQISWTASSSSEGN